MKKILIVEADLKARLALQEILDERRDWRVLKEGSGHDALARLRSLDLPDLCIFGKTVGDGSGADLLRQLRADPAPQLLRVPVLLVTPLEEQPQVAAATRLDPAFFLTQPFDRARVLASVEGVLG